MRSLLLDLVASSLREQAFSFRSFMSFSSDSRSMISSFRSLLDLPTRPATTDLITTLRYSSFMWGSHPSGTSSIIIRISFFAHSSLTGFSRIFSFSLVSPGPLTISVLIFILTTREA